MLCCFKHFICYPMFKSRPEHTSGTDPFLDYRAFLGKKQYSDINSKSFKGLFNIRVIHLDQCSIKTLSNYSFIGLPLLDILFLNNNNIQRITNGVFSGLWNLTELHLEFNELSSIEEGAFSQLESLSILFLHHNNLKTLSNSGMKLLWILDNITLAGNPLSCNCTFIGSFLSQLTNSSSKIFSDLNVSICNNARLRKQISMLYNSTSNSCTNINYIEEVYVAVFDKRIYIIVVVAVLLILSIIYGILAILFARRKRHGNQQTINGYEKVNQKEKCSTSV